LAQVITEEMEARAREYLTSPFTKQLVENAIAAHLMVHTECRLDSRVAIERAVAICAYATADAERISVSLPSGRYASAKNVVSVSLLTDDSGHAVRLNLGMVPSEIEELPIRLTFGTKAARAGAWQAVHEARRVLLQEEARRLREEAQARKA